MALPAIATWFVADRPEEATYFPQVGGQSDASENQSTYLRCVVCFFASSLASNPNARHIFYTNATMPLVDGVDLEALFERWGVAVVNLPITWRLLRGAVRQWGNQFYVFDVMAHHAESGDSSPLILLDCDCIWRQPADEILAELERHGALAYELGHAEYPRGAKINGQTREGLATFVFRTGGPHLDAVPYCGGEFFAATAAMNERLIARARFLWPEVFAQGADAPREEAHLLSALYAAEGLPPNTANRFIRRMWTTFRHNDLRESDDRLAIWHLPAEKHTGFADLFRQIVRHSPADPRSAAEEMGLTHASYNRKFGFPRRHPGKLVRDLRIKLAEKLKST